MSARDDSTARNRAIWDEFIERTYSKVRRLPRPNVPGDSDKYVVIVEPRKHPDLEYVLRNVLHFLDDSWGLQFFCGTENREFVTSITANWGTVHIEALPVSNLDTRAYNQLKKNTDFWQRIRGEHVLWIEPDCLLRRPGLERFLSFDYVGAPWHERLAVSPYCRVGNGGLSLRRVTAMREIAAQANPEFELIGPEDVFFCVNMQLANAQRPGEFKLPVAEEAAGFAVESIYAPDPVGLHKIWAYLDESQIRALLSSIEY